MVRSGTERVTDMRHEDILLLLGGFGMPFVSQTVSNDYQPHPPEMPLKDKLTP